MRRVLTLAVTTLALAACASDAPAPTPSAPAYTASGRPTGYLATPVDGLSIIGAPPAAGSPDLAAAIVPDSKASVRRVAESE